LALSDTSGANSNLPGRPCPFRLDARDVLLAIVMFIGQASPQRGADFVPSDLEINMDIRVITFDDLPDVLRLYAQPDFDNGEVLGEAAARALYARFLAYPDYKIYVAIRDGGIVGSFALLVMLNLGHCGAPSAIVEDVVVDPLLQGTGIGTALMQAAMDLARDKGCYKLVLSSNVKRERAHAFYERLGFTRHGISFSMTL
jgi:GNAT superfamily N-acetyltransferase